MRVSRVLVRLFSIFSLFTVKCNVSVGPGWGIRPLVGFLDEPPGPTVWQLQLFRKKKITNAWGKVGWVRLEFPEPLLTK